MIDRLEIIMPYYNSPGMLTSHLLAMGLFPDEIKKRLTLTIVDDGSQKPALDVMKHFHGKIGLKIKLFRILVDIPWNQHGARNLGADQAKDGWLFITDIDHTLPLRSIEYLFKYPADTRCFFTFARMSAVKDGDGVRYEPMVNENGRPKPHPNTYLLTKDLYWKAGGYDEDFCGTYGGDGPFRRLLDKVGQHKHFDNIHIVRWPREVIPDASQPVEYREKYRALYRELFKDKGGSRSPKPTTWIRFPWERQL